MMRAATPPWNFLLRLLFTSFFSLFFVLDRPYRCPFCNINRVAQPTRDVRVLFRSDSGDHVAEKNLGRIIFITSFFPFWVSSFGWPTRFFPFLPSFPLPLFLFHT